MQENIIILRKRSLHNAIKKILKELLPNADENLYNNLGFQIECLCNIYADQAVNDAYENIIQKVTQYIESMS